MSLSDRASKRSEYNSSGPARRKIGPITDIIPSRVQ